MNDETRHRKRQAVNSAEADGAVADSIDVRKALLARVSAGELSLAEAQAELKGIKKNATKNGLTTRSRAFREG